MSGVSPVRAFKVYRGDFLGTLALARTLRTQATENRKINLGFTQGTYRTSAQCTIQWDLWLHSFVLDRIQSRPDWLSRNAPRRSLL